MAELKNIGVREFRDHATTYLSGSEPIAINKHGRVIGFYVPVERNEHEVRNALAQLGASVDRVLEDTGMTEDDLTALLDLRGPRAT